MKAKKENSMKGHSFTLFLTNGQNQLDLYGGGSTLDHASLRICTYLHEGLEPFETAPVVQLTGDIPAPHILKGLFWRNYHG